MICLSFRFRCSYQPANATKLETRRAATLLARTEVGTLLSLGPPIPHRYAFTGHPEFSGQVSFFYYLVTWSTDITVVPHASRRCVFFVRTSLGNVDVHSASGNRPSRSVFLNYTFPFF